MTSPALPRPQPASPASQPPPPPDLFVLVRPPPGSSAHPLNLQVQLLVPSTAHHHPRPAAGGVSATSLDKVAGASVSRDGEIQHDGAGARRAGASFERARTRSSSRGRASPGAGGAGAGSGRVSRSPSMSSLASGRSGYSAYSGESMGTASSFTGTSTGTGSGRRKVTPLLNLAFHSVLPTVVTDAGTDQRVAKFAKRGVEFTGLAVFDPVDLALPNSLASASTSTATATATATMGPGSPSTSRPSPTPSRAANGAAGTDSTTTSAGGGSAVGGGGGFLTKLKRLSFHPAPPASPTSPASSSSTRSSSKLFSSLSAPSASASPSKPPSSSDPAPAPSGPSLHTLPLLRTSSPPHTTTTSTTNTPGPSSPATPTDRGAGAGAAVEKGYAFVLRKWIRADLEGAPRGVRVEWTRRRRTQARMRADRKAPRGSEAQVAAEEDEGAAEQKDDDDDEEDPDTPWVCTLAYPLSGAHSSPNPAAAAERSGASSPATSVRRGGGGGGLVDDTSPTLSPATATATATATSTSAVRRLHLATLRPAPYHPKLVSTLLLPPLLPSIPLGTFHPSRGLQGGVLGPEELRDLVMVTAMWVAVREGLGGLEGVRVDGGVGGVGEGVEQVVAGLKEKGVKKVVSIGGGGGGGAAKDGGGAGGQSKERRGGALNGFGLGIRDKLFPPGR